MNCCIYLWVVLAAGAISVNGIRVNILRNILDWPTKCQPPQPLEGSHLMHVECEGLAALQDVKQLLKKEEKMWPLLGSLTISNSYLTTNLTVDDLVQFPALHTLTLKKSRLREWRKSRLSSVPSVRKLVVEQCWDNNTFLAKPEQLTLKLSPKLQDALPELEELYFIDNFMPLVAEPTALKNLKRFVIQDGAAKCEEKNLWMLDWYDAGKLEINSTVCFVMDLSRQGLDSMNIIFTFYGLELIQILRFVKSTVEFCPVPCTCGVNGFRDYRSPISFVNCTSANLTQLPDLIPSHTRRLYLSNNRITNISKIFTDSSYQNLHLILLDNNLIKHIDGDLLYNYLKYHNVDFKISFANNKLETLPVERMAKMYEDRTNEGHSVLPTFDLTGNPWNCDDCAFLVPFQYLIYYQFQKKEILNEIRCGEGRHAEGQQIIKLPVKSYCKVDPPLEPLDILNICLGVLLFLFILNFLHNFMQYQRHGKLPWIVNKFPCC